MQISTWPKLALALMIGAAGSQAARAQQLEPIKVSYQPALYWSLPYYVATEKKFWADAGLAPEFSTFPAGAPQVAAAQAKSWDVGGTGSVPAVLGAARFGLVTIGITNDESKANVLMVRGDKFDAVKKDPAIIKGQKILLTSNSTGDYSVQACLKKWGIAKTDVQLVNLGQAQIISAVTSNNGDFAGVWAPNNYTLAEKGGAKLSVQRLRRRRHRAGRADHAAGLRQGETGARRKVSGRLSAGVVVDQGQPEGSARDDEDVLRAGRRGDLRPGHGIGVRGPAGVLAR